MRKPMYVCEICGVESVEEMGDQLMYTEIYADWFIHRIEFVGGWLDLVACSECNFLTRDQMLEGYQKRVREGFILRFH